jgi:5-deoxy-glucuronate isomerase
LGPRRDPFSDAPSGIFITTREKATFTAKQMTLIGVGTAPAKNRTCSTIVMPDKVGGGRRGRGNWERDVRFVLWSDNTEGNMLIAGETVTPSGNWSTIPPHRHQYDIPGEEVPYEEIYFFQFSKQQGYGIAWQFDDEGEMDQAFSLKTNDVLYMDKGYHPTACGPGTALYHLTFISGPYRISRSKVHNDFQFLLEENNMDNPYAKQFVDKKTPF